MKYNFTRVIPEISGLYTRSYLHDRAYLYDFMAKESNMLALSRKVNQEIIIGDSITVTILGKKGNQFKVGISAPSNVSIYRKEIYKKPNLQKINKQIEAS